MGKWMVKSFQIMLNVSLIILGLTLYFFLLRELYFLVRDAYLGINSVHDILGRVLIFFLYFGFVSIIVKYFEENHHFPLRYLLYVGITATVRFIIVNNGKPIENFWLSLVILVLMISYLGLRYFRDERDKIE